MHENLNESNFLLYCAKYYDGKHCSSTQEFLNDIARIKYIKKLITRYQTGDSLNERLILNHIIILNNVFGPIITCNILYFKLKDQFSYVKPFLVLLNILPDVLYNIDGQNKIYTDVMDMDSKIVEVLRKI